MKRLLIVITALTLIEATERLFAQESAAGGQDETSPPTELAQSDSAPTSLIPTNTAPANSEKPSGLLTPPPDNTPTAPTPAPSASTTTTASPSTTTQPAAQKMSAREIARIQQQEIIRRQELVFRAKQALDAAKKAELATDYPEARKNYLFAAEAFGSISRSTDSYATAAEGLTRVDFQLYDDALKIGDTARAKQLMDEVVTYNPNNKLANEKLAAINRALANPNDTTLLGNPAVTPGLVKKVNEVQQYFAEAEQFRRTGQWDEAEARLKHILAIDPYNVAATKELERIDDEKNKYADTARIETRDERLRQVEEKWYEPINNKNITTAAQEAQPSIVMSTSFDLEQKLKNIFISLDFNNATIEEATNFLSIESKRLDPEHKGVNFIIQPEVKAQPISLTLNNVPLGEALRYVCQLANVKYKVEAYAISIVPFNRNTEDLISRTFIVQPNFVAPPASSGVIQSATSAFGNRPVAPPAGGTTPPPGGTTPETPSEQNTVLQALKDKGVNFPPGASAVYNSVTDELTVVDTADQMELLDELVHAGEAPTLMVRIATKFVEINQQDLNDLTVNTGFNLFNPKLQTLIPGNPQTPQFSTALPGALGFSPDSIDQLLTPQTVNLSSLYVRSLLQASQFNLVITALSQKKSYDLLSQPAVMTKSGGQAVLEAVRVFPYPVSFDPPQLQSPAGNRLVVAVVPPAVIPSVPTEFKQRNVGVRLVCKPQVAADNKTIDLQLFPEVTDFEGFINYGSPIFVGNPDGSTSLLSPNTINQPVFSIRRVVTKVLVRDGSTVVLGGLIRDDIQNINDKVPFFGDLPLIGRLFQSKAIENTKRNLIIFVSANIYRNDGELLNPPEVTNAADILTGRATYTPLASP